MTDDETKPDLPAEPTDSEPPLERGWHDALLAVSVLAGPALFGLVLFAFPRARDGIGVAVLTAAASFAVGCLFGFIFGIPRTLSSPEDGGTVLSDGRRKVAPNTNLEQISDWLTKILVGVGLVELGQIGPGISHLAAGVAPSLGNDETGYPVAITIMVSFTIAGFIGSYLFTRLRLENSFSLATFVARKVKQVEQVKKDFDEEAQAAARAEALVENQLSRKGGATKQELEEALRGAPRSARVNAFYLARDQRRANWRDGDLELVERTIPVFEALIGCDERYHRNHGELAYALKDQDDADCKRALEELDRAISLRPPSRAAQYWPYEFNRAWCRIKLDPATEAKEATGAENVDAICADLEAAAFKTSTGREVVKAEQRIQTWMDLNAEHPRVAKLRARLG
jgi:hypothetical protein